MNFPTKDHPPVDQVPPTFRKNFMMVSRSIWCAELSCNIHFSIAPFMMTLGPESYQVERPQRQRSPRPCRIVAYKNMLLLYHWLWQNFLKTRTQLCRVRCTHFQLHFGMLFLYGMRETYAPHFSGICILLTTYPIDNRHGMLASSLSIECHIRHIYRRSSSVHQRSESAFVDSMPL